MPPLRKWIANDMGIHYVLEENTDGQKRVLRAATNDDLRRIQFHPTLSRLNLVPLSVLISSHEH